MKWIVQLKQSAKVMKNFPSLSCSSGKEEDKKWCRALTVDIQRDKMVAGESLQVQLKEEF